MKRSLLAWLVACLVCCAPYVAKADDESESLALLVDVLAASDVPAVHAALLQGMLSGLEGRRNVTAPKGWSQLSAKLAKSDDKKVRDLTLQLSQIFGDREAAAVPHQPTISAPNGAGRRDTEYVTADATAYAATTAAVPAS